MNRLRISVTGCVVACAALLAGASAAQPVDRAAHNGFDVAGALVPVAAIERGGPPKDGIPAIDRPKFVDGKDAALAPHDRVLGLALHGLAKAYPVRILNWHEVVNDRFGAVPVAVTYCPLCGTGIAFDARLGDKVLNFGVSGLLYNSDVLLYDRGSESLWSQLKQLAVAGPLKGTSLTALPLEHTTWKDWRTRHPDTLVLSTDTGHVRDYRRDPYAGYDQVARLMFHVSHRDERIAVKEWVLGVSVGSARKAYPFTALQRATGGSGEVNDTVGGQAVVIRYDGPNRTARAFDARQQPLPGVMAFWFAWAAFNPDTKIFSAPR